MNEITSLAHVNDGSKFKKGLMRLRSGTIFLVIVVFAILGVILGYYLFGSGINGMFDSISYETSGNDHLSVEFKTQAPARTYIEYGTSSDILNKANVSRTFETEHAVEIQGLLPAKTHVFRVVAEDNAGDLYKSDFYTVE